MQPTEILTSLQLDKEPLVDPVSLSYVKHCIAVLAAVATFQETTVIRRAINVWLVTQVFFAGVDGVMRFLQGGCS